MKWLSEYNSFNGSSVLIIVDVQRSFSKFFTEKYIRELKEYCKKFKSVYQIWDNHIHGKNVDKDYLYDHDPETPHLKGDIYQFPNQKDLIEKRYNYDVDVDFYKKILDNQTYNDIKVKEKNNTLKRGDIFKTKEGTAIVYIGNNHKWHHISKKLYNIFNELKGKEVTIVGGSENECLLDILVAGESMGVKIKKNWSFIYSANHCPIK